MMNKIIKEDMGLDTIRCLDTEHKSEHPCKQAAFGSRAVL